MPEMHKTLCYPVPTKATHTCNREVTGEVTCHKIQRLQVRPNLMTNLNKKQSHHPSSPPSFPPSIPSLTNTPSTPPPNLPVIPTVSTLQSQSRTATHPMRNPHPTPATKTKIQTSIPSSLAGLARAHDAHSAGPATVPRIATPTTQILHME